jgi:hypothetical protein
LLARTPGLQVGSSAYPKPESIRWDRPRYAESITESSHLPSDNEDDLEGDQLDELGLEQVSLPRVLAARDARPATQTDKAAKPWCTRGVLFKDGSSSGDVVQGTLGDCWFLGALSVLATQEDALQQCFWPPEQPDRSSTSPLLPPSSTLP